MAEAIAEEEVPIQDQKILEEVLILMPEVRYAVIIAETLMPLDLTVVFILEIIIVIEEIQILEIIHIIDLHRQLDRAPTLDHPILPHVHLVLSEVLEAQDRQVLLEVLEVHQDLLVAAEVADHEEVADNYNIQQ